MILGLLAFTASSISEVKIQQDAEYTVAGITAPAEIIVDRWGVPHLYAADHYDAFFVQGFNAARDRLWQIDLWRKRGLGLLSATFGDSFAAQDEAARLFLYRDDMYMEWLAYGNDAKRIATSFADGINAYVALTEREPRLLPPEFSLMNYRPERWSAADIVRIRGNGLWRNVIDEVWRAQLACAGQLDTAARWKQLEPTWQTSVPEGLDPCAIPANVLDKYKLAKAPVSFDAPQLTLKEVALQKVALQDTFDHSLGSNNWVVAPSRTTTGRPILADDPHRGHSTPSLRYIAHLSAPGINVIGAGEPALPGISIGHNETIAFGLTIFPIDQEDLYVYERRGEGYRYQGRTEPLKTLTETIDVKGAAPKQVELQFTRHGPVIAMTKKHIFAVRAAWLEPGMSPYFGSIEYMRAKNFREFVGALNRWGAPSENQVYADVDGNIGYKPAGRFPKRHNWDGLLPVPGDGRYEWDGYFDMDVLPEEYNPSRGYSGTANSMNLPPDYPIDDYRIGFEWSAPWRYNRLWEVLKQDDQHTMQGSLDLQRDYHSVLARETMARLPDIGDQPGGKLLARWDQILAPDSAAAALWNVWYNQFLNPGLSNLIGPQPPVSRSLDSLTVLELLETEAGKNVARSTLAQAHTAIQEKLGTDSSQWQWGDLHQIKFAHPLLHLASAELKSAMLIDPYPSGGSANTTNNTGFRNPNTFDVASGASFRMVVDVGNWDAALATNAPGQSGDPRSKFYDNLLENWATEQSFPLLYTRAAIEANEAFRIKLNPIEQD
ncbi:MAG: penicillin acylase family protein [Pseudomonadales bacterium]|nr:penicillin acylase family protein [Pseudomonadales bacterium]